MELKVAKTLDEYCQIIVEEKSKTDILWYRGMGKATYTLTPSLFREKRLIGFSHSGREINGNYYRKSEAIMKSDLAAIDIFIEYYNSFYPEKTKNYKLVDYLYIMQHYDVPTRLLDFSRNEFAALYFSVESSSRIHRSDEKDEIEDFMKNDGYSEKGSSIHLIDPVFTNKNSNEFKNIKDNILNIDDINIDVLSKIYHPLCIETKNNDSRIVNQDGVFVLFGVNYKSYEEYEIFNPKTTKIFIPNSCRESIKNELKDKFNVSHSSIYPDMKGISLEIIDEIERKYKSDCQSIFGN